MTTQIYQCEPSELGQNLTALAEKQEQSTESDPSKVRPIDSPRLVYVALQLLDVEDCEMVRTLPSSSRSSCLLLCEVGDAGGGQQADGSRRGDSSSLAGREVAGAISVS